ISFLLFVVGSVLTCLTALLIAAEKGDLQAVLLRSIIGPRLATNEMLDYIESRVITMPHFQTVDQWEQYANELRKNMIKHVIFRGEAAAWRDAKTRVEWLETVPGGPGYRIKKLRYEAVPGLWIPALLYEPENLNS